MCPPPDKRGLAHAENLRVGRWSETFGCYAIAKCLARREPILAEPGPAGIILSSLKYLREIGEVRLLAFCVMPDHYHALIFLTGHKSLSGVMSSLNKFTAKRLNGLLSRRGEFWQEGFYDHRCRDEDDIEDRMTYIEHNPVRAGLVGLPENWPFSSAHPLHVTLLDRNWYAQMK